MRQVPTGCCAVPTPVRTISRTDTAGRQLAGAVTTERGACECLAEELEAVLEALEVRLGRVVAVVDARRLERVGAADEHGALGLLTVQADDDRGGAVDLVERDRESPATRALRPCRSARGSS